MTHFTIHTHETAPAAIGVQGDVKRPEDLDRLSETAASIWHWQTGIDFAEASPSWRLLALPMKRTAWQPLIAFGWLRKFIRRFRGKFECQLVRDCRS